MHCSNKNKCSVSLCFNFLSTPEVASCRFTSAASDLIAPAFKQIPRSYRQVQREEQWETSTTAAIYQFTYAWDQLVILLLGVMLTAQWVRMETRFVTPIHTVQSSITVAYYYVTLSFWLSCSPNNCRQNAHKQLQQVVELLLGNQLHLRPSSSATGCLSQWTFQLFSKLFSRIVFEIEIVWSF